MKVLAGRSALRGWGHSLRANDLVCCCPLVHCAQSETPRATSRMTCSSSVEANLVLPQFGKLFIWLTLSRTWPLAIQQFVLERWRTQEHDHPP